jgi:hypothetical protein
VVKTKILRGIAIAIAVLGTIAIVFGFLPGIEVYRDVNDCFGRAFGSLFGHDSARGCQASYQLVETRSVVDRPVGMAFYFAVLMAPALVVWRYPQLKLLLGWTLLAIGATFLMIVAMFDFGSWSDSIVRLWPADVFAVVLTIMLSVLIVGLPVFCAIYAFVTRTRPPPKPEVARARIHREL